MHWLYLIPLAFTCLYLGIACIGRAFDIERDEIDIFGRRGPPLFPVAATAALWFVGVGSFGVAIWVGTLGFHSFAGWGVPMFGFNPAPLTLLIGSLLGILFFLVRAAGSERWG